MAGVQQQAAPARQRIGRRLALLALVCVDLAIAPNLLRLGRGLRGDLADAARRVCVGDCDDNGIVNEGEVLTGIAIALAEVALDTCEAFDVVVDGQVTVDENVRAVADALGPCRFATITPTIDQPTPFTPLPRPRVTPSPR